MEFSFESQGATTYLVYSIAPYDEVDTMGLGMITNNKISGIAPAIYTQMDDQKYIKYNVSSKNTVEQFFKGTEINKKKLIGVFLGMANAIISAEEYMIDSSMLLLDLDYIFVDVSTYDTVMVCVPIEIVKQTSMDLGMFFKSIVFSKKFDQTENCDYLAKIINYLNSAPVFSVHEFKELLEQIKNEGSQPAYVAQPVVNQPVQQPVVQQPVAPQPVVQQPAAQPVVNQPVQHTPVNAVPNTQMGVPGQAPGGIPGRAPMNVPGNAPMNRPGQAPGQIPTVTQPQGKNKKDKKNANKVEIPNMPNTPNTPNVQPAQAGAQNGEKEMSWFYLMQHYNKENAATYKAQKEAKKAAKAQAQGMPPVNTHMGVPGQVPGGVPGRAPMNVPGQAPAGAPGKTPMNIPGQAPMNIPGQNPSPVQQPAVQKQQVVPQPQVQPAAQATPQPMSQVTPQPIVQPTGMPANFGETTVLGGGMNMGETTVLSGGMQDVVAIPYLIRMKNNEKIMLNKPVFRIGKEKSYVDYFIGDNSAISRSHANFVTRDNEYFIVDTNSTNHTYLNGVILQSNVETKLTNGAKVRLANEEFEFRI